MNNKVIKNNYQKNETENEISLLGENLLNTQTKIIAILWEIESLDSDPECNADSYIVNRMVECDMLGFDEKEYKRMLKKITQKYIDNVEIQRLIRLYLAVYETNSGKYPVPRKYI